MENNKNLPTIQPNFEGPGSITGQPIAPAPELGLVKPNFSGPAHGFAPEAPAAEQATPPTAVPGEQGWGEVPVTAPANESNEPTLELPAVVPAEQAVTQQLPTVPQPELIHRG